MDLKAIVVTEDRDGEKVPSFLFWVDTITQPILFVDEYVLREVLRKAGYRLQRSPAQAAADAGMIEPDPQLSSERVEVEK